MRKKEAFYSLEELGDIFLNMCSKVGTLRNSLAISFFFFLLHFDSLGEEFATQCSTAFLSCLPMGEGGMAEPRHSSESLVSVNHVGLG